MKYNQQKIFGLIDKRTKYNFLRDDSEGYVVNGICEKMNQKPLSLLCGGGLCKLDIAADPRHIARLDDEKEGGKTYPRV